MLGFLRDRLSQAAKGVAESTLQDSSPSSQLEPQHTVSDVIEQIGAGPAQLRMALVSCPIWFVDGAEMLLISSVAKAVTEEWSLSAFQRGFVVSLVYIGIGFGNLMSGSVSDSVGRRLPILASFFFIFVFSVGSGLAWSYVSVCFFRVLVGVAVGVGQPAQQALMCEVTPSKWRVVFTSIGMGAFYVGELFVALVLFADDPTLEDLHWRFLLIVGALPSAVFGVLALLFLRQSPLYLACGGRYEETREVLESFRHDNSRHDVSIDFKPHKVLCGGSGISSALQRQLRIVFGSDYLSTTLIMIYSCFVANLSFYGGLYAFPTVMVTSTSFGSSPVVELIYGSLMEIAAEILTVLCIWFLERKPVMRISMLLQFSALLAFAVACPLPGNGFIKQVFVYYGYYGIKFFNVFTFTVIYLYVAEVFPTAARTTGTGLAFAGGRVSAVLSSLVFEMIMSWCAGQYEIFFYLMALLTGVNFVLINILPYETFGKVLEEETAEASMETEQGRYGAA